MFNVVKFVDTWKHVSPAQDFFSLESKTGQFQEDFDLVLLADYDIQPRVSLSKPVQRSVISKCWADKQDVIKLATKWATELVNEKLSFSRVSLSNDKRIEWNVDRIHFNTVQILTGCSLC